MNSLISIVVPIYNASLFLEETIESVIAQTYTNWELLLIDDGSTDKSSTICKSYAQKDQRIRYYFKVNGGQASARNYGISKSKSDYITFLDADDLYLRDKLAIQVNDLETIDADFYYGGGYTLAKKNKEQKIEGYDWFYGQYTGTDFFRILYHSCAVNINTVLFRKELFNEVGQFDESQILRGVEDLDLWLRIALRSKIVYGNPAKKVYYRIHPNGIHFRKADMLIGKWMIYAKFDDSIPVNKLARKKEYRYVIRELMNALLNEKRSKEIKPFFDQYYKKDSFGFVAIIQSIIIRFTSPKTFLKISNSIIYRFGYRLEKLTYLFLKK